MRQTVAALLACKMAALAPVEVRLRPALREDVDALYALEAASYPADEAASRDALAYRQREAGDFFRVVTVDDDDCAGFVCGTRCATFEEESMAKHDPSGNILAIHSVVVKPALRRRGIALRALRRYVHDVRRGRTCATIALIAKAPLLPLYRKAGFEVQGLSEIVHGRDPWFECALDATAFPYEVIDSFSSVTFGGNPAAVVLGEGSEDWMKGVAAEFNLSETAFLRFIEGNRFGLRWLTPTAEVDLCGHATLAAAHFLLGREPYDELIFETRSGDLVATKKNDLIELAFPRDDPMEVVDLKIKGQLLKALSVEDIVSVHRSGQRDLLVTLTAEAFQSMNVDLAKINEIERIRGVVPCCAGDVRDEGQADFSSRFFGPAVGIDEDPVTGSAHCALAPLFMKRCGGKRRLVGYQASARGGEVVCDVAGPLVKLSGRATAVMAGVVKS